PLPVLVNQAAGSLSRASPADDLPGAAESAGIPIEIMVCDGPGVMRQTVCRLRDQGAGTIAVAGGDGTVALVAQELAHTTVDLGIIPAGTANNFATALGLPRDWREALEVVRDGGTERVDLGKAGERYFTESAGVGLFADSLEYYGRRTGKHFGKLVYAAGRLLMSARARRMKLTIDGEQVVERAVMCEVANTYRMGLGAPVAPEANPADGWLDVVLIGDLSRWELLRYYRAVMAERHLELPKVKATRARRVTIEALHPMNVHCDDRIIGTTPAEFSVARAALRVRVPRS
ncbi:MAG TPA: diacylglycerol kinase family protein, partial [Candidatus Eisenbacteria bacterium]